MDSLVPCSSIDFDSILAQADPEITKQKDLFREIGRCCNRLDSASEKLGDTVRKLRAINIKIRDWSSFQVAKAYISECHKKISAEALEKYTHHLVGLLEMPEDKLPERISISAPVPQWIHQGDEIDVMDSKQDWWHGVVLEVSKRRFKIYWVGFEKSEAARSRYAKNPEYVNKRGLIVRPHIVDETKSGPQTHIDVPSILREDLHMPKKTFAEVVDESSGSDESETGDETKSRLGKKKGK